MYSVSNKYIQDMKEPTARFTLRGTIGTKSFTEANLASGSFFITNQCVDNDEILLGAAYVGELRGTFQDVDIDRYEWVGKVITPYHVRIFPDNTSEEIPLGVFTIAEAVWSADGVSVIAYDNMAKFDKTADFSATTGTPYGILYNICQLCGLTLGMTQAEVEALPNGTEMLGLWADNDIETYRDMISWLAQALASIVLIDRQGRVYLRKYGMTPVDEVTEQNRFMNASFSDFESRYSGVSVVDLQSETTRYYGTEDDRFLTYNLGANPWMQFGVLGTRERMARAVLNALASVAYVPFSVTMLGDPAYDLGDVLTLSGGMGDGSKHFVIQRYSYKLHNNYEAEGVGKNPDLANAKSKSDKQIAALLNNTKQNEIQYYFFTNAETITIADGSTRNIIDVRFSSLKATVVLFEAEVLLDAETTASGITYNDLVGTVTYYIDGTEVLTRYPVETWVDGKHILHLLYHINIGDAQLCRFVATLTAEGGRITIPANGVEAVIHGQGLAAVEDWGGYLDFEETLSPLTLQSITVKDNITDSVTVDLHTPHAPALSDTLGKITLGGITLKSFNEVLLIDKKDMSDFTHQGLTPYTHEDLETSFIHG